MSTIYSFKSIFTPNLEDKDIKRIYNKRRKLLKANNCPRCGNNLAKIIFNHRWFPEQKGEVLAKGGITKDKKCPKCETDLIEFCFQDLLDEAKDKAKNIVKQAKNTPNKKSERVNKNSSSKKCNTGNIKKKCCNKKSIAEEKGQGSLW